MAPHDLRERSYELGRAHEALLRARSSGDGHVLILTGEPGIGKSAVLGAIRRDALELGFAVGFGKADEVNQIAPGAPVLLALRSGSTPLLDEVGFRSLAPLYDKTLWLVDQIAELLEIRAQRGPLLVVLDDMQWADQLSQFAVRALSSRLIGSPVVWVLASRPSPDLFLGEPDAATLFEDKQPEHLPLAPLSEAAVLELATELLGGPPPVEPAATLGRLGGNPFLIVQLCQGVISGPDQDAGQGRAHIPLSLTAALQARLSALSDAALDLVEVAAVWGVPLPFAAARQLVSSRAADLLEHAQLAASAGLLRLTGSGVAFRHDLLRQYVYDGLTESRRAGLHAGSTAYLLSSGAGAAAAVPHARIAAARRDPVGIELLRRAARECRVVTPLTAAALMQEAFAASRPGDAGWEDVGEECADFLSSVQRGADVTAVVDALLAQPHSAEFEARLQVLAARALWLVGQFDDMARRTGRALAHSGVSRPLHSRLQAARALALSRLGPMETARSSAEAGPG